jgi:peptide chain release factor 3
MAFEKEIRKRRTFGIISHPDAGKTTLTEKLLLFGGAIQEAGAVKSNKVKKAATSDFMEIEKQRGISVATSVMGFLYKDKKINILDTPGHQDFAEDTYRTLTACDSVIVVIDVAKGVEAQTEKLVKVCRMRDTPIIVFINKLDREGKDGFDLIDEVEQKLGLTLCPLSWPVGMGQRFQGVYNMWEKNLHLYSSDNKQKISEGTSVEDINDPLLEERVGDEAALELRNDLELLEAVYPEFDQDAYLKGAQCPVFFGSALNNFGVRELLDCFQEIAPEPQAKEAEERIVEPNENQFSGFVFKIHANIDPNHRNRIAFLKVVSGKFERNKTYVHTRTGKTFRVSAPTAFMASKKSTIEEAFPGDIIGIPDNGSFRIGDTVSEKESLHYMGIPSFSPEHFRFINNADPLKAKQLNKGVDQLMDEGVAQLFTLKQNNRKIIGTVGALQYEVIQYRLEHEYNAKCTYENFPAFKACWIESHDERQLKEFSTLKQRYLAEDKFSRLVFLADSQFSLQMAQDKFDKITFHLKSEF